MDKNEYWFLNAAWRYNMPLHFLPRKRVLEGENMRSHDLLPDKIIRVLDTLFRRGDIVAWSWKPDEPDPPRFVPTYQQIKAALMEDQDINDIPLVTRTALAYELTPQGAARWETASQPDWERYFVGGSRYPPSSLRAGYYYVEATSREWVETVVESHYAGVSAIPGTMYWEVVTPWKVSYWKLLPVVHRMIFKPHYVGFKICAPWYKNPYAKAKGTRHN